MNVLVEAGLDVGDAKDADGRLVTRLRAADAFGRREEADKDRIARAQSQTVGQIRSGLRQFGVLDQRVGPLAVGAAATLKSHFRVGIVIGVGNAGASQSRDVARLFLAGQVRFLLDDDEIGKVGRVEPVDVFDEKVVAVFDVDVQRRLLREREFGEIQVVEIA